MAEFSPYEAVAVFLFNNLWIIGFSLLALFFYAKNRRARSQTLAHARALREKPLYWKPEGDSQIIPIRLDTHTVKFDPVTKTLVFSDLDTQDFSFVKKSRPIDDAGPKVFYYMDEKTVENLYFQLFPEVVPKQITQTKSGGTEKGLHGGIPIVEGKYEKTLSEQTVTEYEVRQRPTMMYSKVERVLNSQEKITYGLENFEVHDELIDDFKKKCEAMKTEFKFQVSVELQSKWTSDRMKEHATKYIEFLSSVSGYVQVQAKFSVTQPSPNECLLSYIHPLSQHLPLTERKVTIQVSCAKNYVTTSGSNLLKQGSIVNLTCFGKAVGLNTNLRTLNIVPIAVY